MAIFIGLLVGLLGVFIDWLFKSWLDTKTNPFTPGAKPLSFADAKPLFMAKVQKRFWYGPGRLDMASKLYDKAAARYASGDPKYFVDTSTDAAAGYAALAKKLVDGLTP